jgi:hypothetical protein
MPASLLLVNIGIVAYVCRVVMRLLKYHLSLVGLLLNAQGVTNGLGIPARVL